MVFLCSDGYQLMTKKIYVNLSDIENINPYTQNIFFSLAKIRRQFNKEIELKVSNYKGLGE